jgi:hypothetical protein
MQVAAGSSEEDALMLDLENILISKVAEADSQPGPKPPEDSIAHLCSKASKEEKLMCLRGRKCNPERAAKLLPQLLQLKKDYDLENTAEGASTERLKIDLSTNKVRHSASLRTR